jgi:hypothetical protein
VSAKSKLLSAVSVVSSRVFILWLLAAWVVYYVTSAVVAPEAFARFAHGLGESILLQIGYTLFLVSAFLNLLRAFRVRFAVHKFLGTVWMVLPVGIFLVLLGFFVSLATREHAWNKVGLGDMVIPPWEKSSYRVFKIDVPIGEKMLYEEEESGIFQYEPAVWVGKTPGETVRIGAFPPSRIGDTYYNVLDFGLAPGVRLAKGREVIQAGHVILKILPPGAEDVFALGSYRLSLRILPERIMEKGKTKVRVYDFVSPAYHVSVYRGDELVFEGDSRKGVFFEGHELSFMKPEHWVWLQAARDPGMNIFRSGLAIMVPEMFLLRAMPEAWYPAIYPILFFRIILLWAVPGVFFRRRGVSRFQPS